MANFLYFTLLPLLRIHNGSLALRVFVHSYPLSVDSALSESMLHIT